MLLWIGLANFCHYDTWRGALVLSERESYFLSTCKFQCHYPKWPMHTLLPRPHIATPQFIYVYQRSYRKYMTIIIKSVFNINFSTTHQRENNIYMYQCKSRNLANKRCMLILLIVFWCLWQLKPLGTWLDNIYTYAPACITQCTILLCVFVCKCVYFNVHRQSSLMTEQY